MTTRTQRWDEEDGVARRAVDEVVVLAAVGQRLGRSAGQVVRAARRTALHLGTVLTAAATESARAGGRAAVEGAHRVTGSPRPRVRWPWVFAGVAVTATVAAALVRRGPVAPPPAPAPPRVQDVRAETEGPDGPGHHLPGLEAPGRETPGPEPVRAPTS